ncbi:MAG: PTS sugar transporter subunit IIA [Spirochaetales bacterium]|nr:PTS sugar transporter subunit IIA [Spirochaetales bacterium]
MEELNTFIRGSVICNLEHTDKYEAIHELIEKAPIFRKIDNRELIESAVIQREHIESTGLGQGIAIAHGKCPQVRQVLVALGISRTGVEYEALDGHPVNFLFLVANPPKAWDEYLKTLSSLVTMMKDPRFRDRLLEPDSETRLEELLHRKMEAVSRH